MGLIGGMARTAVVAGTATAVSNRVSRRQAGRWAAKEQQPPEEAYEPAPEQDSAPPPPPQDTGVDLDKLKQLGELRDSGVLTDAEFQTQKARILAG
ncbi:SHOCT domain-containing protein [Terrabacter sp. 2YAF2]|uniref:SHOCT domain-containing protein n=1 Tax=Terrabacter sp. 2YAF2 TaxID=3233026 RepID=UPI003F9727D7